MPLHAVTFGFCGSFQCRLATNSDPADASPEGPWDHARDVQFWREGNGWTFDYSEARFDRKIRLRNPVSLRRDGNLDPWRDTVCNIISVDRGRGPVNLGVDALLNSHVSLGDNTYFDEALGAGVAQDAVVNPELQLGNAPTTACWRRRSWCSPTIRTISIPTLEGEYRTRKSGAVFSIGDDRRKSVVHRFSDRYAEFYAMMGSLRDVPMQPPRIGGGATGILAEVAAGAPGTWKLSVDFSRFDGDTLTGIVNGWVTGEFPPGDNPRR